MQFQIALAAVLLSSLMVFPVMAIEADEERKRARAMQPAPTAKCADPQAGLPIHQQRSADWNDTDSIPREFFDKLKIDSASF